MIVKNRVEILLSPEEERSLIRVKGQVGELKEVVRDLLENAYKKGYQAAVDGD